MSTLGPTTTAVLHASFTLVRTYPSSPERVFAAWADPALKRAWFVGEAGEHQLDFRPGGVERNENAVGGKRLTFTSRYEEIVSAARIVFTSVLAVDDAPATVSVTSVELTGDGDGCRLTLTQSSAYLDGREPPQWREEGTGSQLDALGRHLAG
jgi:uncharacterized protein YndB with AHSA1/START domain